MNLFAQLNAINKKTRELTAREKSLAALKAGNDARHDAMVERYCEAFGKRTLTTLQLSEILGDAKTTVAKRVADLEREGFIEAVGKVPGRKTVLWRWKKR